MLLQAVARIALPLVALTRRSVAMQVGASGTARELVLITDFDGTCTDRDTTGLVAQLAARRPGQSTPDAHVLAIFNELEQSYLSLLSQSKASHLGAKASAAGGCYDGVGLEEALAAFDAVSDEVTERLSASGILAGMDAAETASILAEWHAAVEGSGAPHPPALRAGCAEALEALAASGWELGVLSLNWWPPLIRAYLPLLAQRGARLWCNDIDAAGVVSSDVNGAAAKRGVISKFRHELSDARGGADGGGSGNSPLIVYIGDSATDLLAMLEADIGVLIGESQSAREIARTFGVRLEPLEAARSRDERTGHGVVYEAGGDWDAIRAVLEAL